MIRFSHVSYRYDSSWVIDDLDLEVADGELLVVVGPTGSGKSTLLKMIDGLVPHFSGGEMLGDVVVAGRSVRETPPTELAGTVGYVGQDPTATFVTDVVEEEIAYAMENLGIDPAVMRRRVEEALDLMSLNELRGRRLATLSGGQRQRVAIAAVLAAAPGILVLDEPTSALDPSAAEEVLSSLTRLVHDVGMTVVLAEHRLERVLPFADRVILLDGTGGALVGEPGPTMANSTLAPPLIELGRLAGWSPLPVTVREARRQAGPLQEALRSVPTSDPEADGGAVVASAEGLCASFGSLLALDGVDLAIRAGTITAVMGRNGSGKSTLLGCLAGTMAPSCGSATVGGTVPARLSASDRIRTVGFVPQEASLLLYAQRVDDECATADEEHGLAPGTTAASVAAIAGPLAPDRHPRDLSEGQKLALALGIVLAPAPRLVLLDEPTRGLDYEAKRSLVAVLESLRARGVAVVVATHDVELVAQVADHAVVLAQGEVIASGGAREVVCHTPAFAPQVAKVLSPLPWLTVHEVAGALEGAGR
jgi:energy-coupling factor transport system ATP-binding protein